MIKYSEFIGYLNERYVNLIGDDTKKNEYVDQVWDLLQKSYAKIGGIKGSGFKDKDDMIKNIPFWKLNVKNGKIKTLVMYKDKQGRKSVAVATDGTKEAIDMLSKDMKNEIKRSFSEKSGPSLGLTMKTLPFDVIMAYAIKPDEVKKILNDDVTPLSKYEGKLDQGDKRTIEKFPKLYPYFYLRNIGGNTKLKVMLGSVGNEIVRR